MDFIRVNLSEHLATNSVRMDVSILTSFLMTWEQLVLLVGGFATSPWLSEQLEKRLSGLGLKICKPDTQT